MSRKITIRVDEEKYCSVKEEYLKFGYKSLSSYISKLLEERTVIEISDGKDLAITLHHIRSINSGDLRLERKKEELCQLYDSLTIEIEKMLNSLKSLTTSSERTN